jgi:hypothetical protein
MDATTIAGESTLTLGLCEELRISSESIFRAEEVTDEDEELVEKCLDVICQERRASTSLL